MRNLRKIAKAQMIQMEALNQHYQKSLFNFFGFQQPTVVGTWNKYWSAKRMERTANNVGFKAKQLKVKTYLAQSAC